jgi:tetratricopeptide (TPR) repeat protein
MPRISLRAYEKQLEDLIEQNRIQEAIDHCRYILQTYPKCISTYRILGKAFLEGKQYDNSADVFKRVLTVFPDDFISHAGMSIVQENENNLDAAIWHMELAFDCQPSNVTIQEELKRLFGRRDGTHPAKIRLTRGALVRMYAKGELFPQAIAEIKSALSEDPKRLDLEVLLAKMYFQLGDTNESMNECTHLIQELPYCYEINKILVAVLPNSDKPETYPIYLGRLKALNPYEAFVSEKYSTDADVPDDLVMLDQLDSIKASASTTETPDWVKAMDSKWEEPETSESVKWLPPSDGTKNIVESSPMQQPQIPVEETQAIIPDASVTDKKVEPSESDNSLPDWMQDAGWLPTHEETANADKAAFKSLVEDEPVTPEPADNIPDWLRSLAPEETELPKAAESVFSAPAEETPAVNLPVEEESVVPAADQSQEASNEDLPDWLKNFENENTSSTEENIETPDWMKSIQQNEQAEPATPDVLKTPLFDESKEIVGNENAQPSSPAVAEPKLAETTPLESQESDIPDWIKSVIEQTPAAQEPSLTDQKTEPVPTGLNSTESLFSDETGNEDTALSEKSGDDLLSWLRDLKPEEPSLSEETSSSESTETSALESEVFDDGSPLDRLNDLTKPSTGELISEESAALPKEETEVPVQPLEEETVAQENPVESVEIPSPEASEPLEPAETVEPEPAAVVEETQPVETVSETLSAETTLPEASVKTADPIEQLKSQSEADPNNYLTWQQLGDAYAKENDFTNALRSYNKAEELILNQK